MSIYSHVLKPSEVAAFIGHQGALDMSLIKKGMLDGAMQSMHTLDAATRTARPANPAGIGTGGAVNIGGYLRGWFYSRIPNGVSIFNKMPYSPIIEGGRRRGKRPPSKVLVPWVIRRLGVSEKEARGVAFVIARAIGKRGLLPRKVLGGVIPQITANIMAGIKRAVLGGGP